MFPEHTTWSAWATAMSVAAFLVGCSADIAAKTPVVDSDPAGTPSGAFESAKARVKFKDQGRFVRDLASGLELAPGEVCSELGLYDCYEQAHRITLGGVEPYNRGIRDPLPIAPVTAPIAVDRVALSACSARADRDFDSPGAALMFGTLASEGASQEALEGAAREIYRRLLRREATADEVSELVAFHAEADTLLANSSESPTREWAVASCFAVATTMEGLFY